MIKKSTFILSMFVLLFAFAGCDENTGNNGNGDGDEVNGLPGNQVNAIYITDDGLRYFATNNGLAAFDGQEWMVYNENPKVETGTINDMDFELTAYGPEFWMATDEGVNVVSLPVDATSGATRYHTGNVNDLFPGDTVLKGDSVFVVKVDGNNFRWFGTQEGISVFMGDTWPEIVFGNNYAPGFFQNNRVTSIDYSNDTVYIGTMGGGVARMVDATADAISGASPYEHPWSSLPSMNILAVFTDGSDQWYGSDEGVAKHTGTKAKDNWKLYFESDGLISNTVNCITKDIDGNMWFGTPDGISSFDGTTFTNYTTADGLVANTILSVAVDLDGSIWFGTDNGVSHFDGSGFTNYQHHE